MIKAAVKEGKINEKDVVGGHSRYHANEPIIAIPPRLSSTPLPNHIDHRSRYPFHVPHIFSYFSKPSLTMHNHQFPNWATVTCIFCRFLHISISSPPIWTNLILLESPCQHESTIVTSDGFGPAVVLVA